MYEQRIYENVDCVVGYRFCNVMFCIVRLTAGSELT